MLHQLINFPRTTPLFLACSGGVDSMAVADFYRQGGKDLTLCYFNHGTQQSNKMWEVVMKYAGQHKLKHQIGFLMNYRAKDKSESPEEYWRNARYDWLFRTARGNPLITAQHLGDAVEGWIFSCLHGNPKLINYKRDNLYRPFLTTMKSDLVAWSVKNGVEWLEDASNQDTNFPRNRIRNEMMEQCLKINPGIHKTIKKKILNQLELSVVAT